MLPRDGPPSTSSADATLGTVVDVVRDGELLVESPDLEEPLGDPPMGEQVVDRRHDVVGEIVDVVGPVASPYFLVAPDGPSSGTRVVGKEVYAP